MKNKILHFCFIFILISSLVLAILLTMKNYHQVEEYEDQINAPYLMAKSIIEEPKLLEKWLYFSELWQFQDFIRVKNDKFISLNIFDTYPQQFQIQLETKQKSNNVEHTIIFLDYFGTQIRINLAKKEAMKQSLTLRTTLNTQSSIFNTIIYFQKQICRRNILLDITKQFVNLLKKEIQRQEYLRIEWESQTQLNQI